MLTEKSEELFRRAQRRIPGGVNSPVRAFKSVGRNPLFLSRASGSRVWDVDGNEYIDYVGSWGPMILGHAHPKVLEAIRKTAEHGTSFGASTELEVKMAEMICHLMPSVEMVRMVNSGTEATMSALRLARAYTGKEKVIKFAGCYHGHADSFLIKAGSGASTLGIPDSPGVPQAVASSTLNATYNDLDSVGSIVSQHESQIAAIIVEPVAGNMGCVAPKPGFLQGLREICTREGIVFIVDEIITGFRLARGGAQELYAVHADLTTLGKIIGGGLPVGAYGGRLDIMEMVAPSGPMYQAGTLSGNPLALAAGYETLSLISEDKRFYTGLEKKSQLLADGITSVVKELQIPATLNRVGSMFTLFFTAKEVNDYDSAKQCDMGLFASYYRAMLERRIFLPPSQFETAFISAAHTDSDIEQTVQTVREGLRTIPS